jgi:hypothetical protein
MHQELHQQMHGVVVDDDVAYMLPINVWLRENIKSATVECGIRTHDCSDDNSSSDDADDAIGYHY